MLDLNLIKTFLDVAKTKNLHVTAQRLGVTQSAVSQRISALEAQTGKSLFLRRSGMELNRAGEELLQHCKGFGENIRCIDDWILSESHSLSGEIRMFTTYGMAGRMLPAFLKTFLAKYTNARFFCESVESSPQVEEAVLNGSADLGIIAGVSQKPSLKMLKLMKNNSVLMVCSPDYELANKRKITKEDLAQARLLVHTHKGSRTMASIFRKLGFQHHQAENIVRFPDMETCKMHALEGVGIAFVANIYVYDEIKKGRLIALPGFKLTTPLYLVSRNEKYIFPIVQTFKREFLMHCQEFDRLWS